MKTIYKMTEWQSPTGVWYVSNTQDLGHDSGAWWLPARFLNMSLDDYIKMLIDEYHVSYIKFLLNIIINYQIMHFYLTLFGSTRRDCLF